MGTTTSKQTSMAQQHLQQHEKVIERIIQCVQKSKATNPQLESFIRQAYMHVPLEELAEISEEEWFHVARALWSFMGSRSKNEPKLRVWNPDPKKDGWESGYTIVEIVNDDMPFLVDSITAALNAQNLKIYQIIHPIIGVVRDSKGRMTSLLDAQQAQKEAHYESVMHFHITRITDKEQCENLDKHLMKVLRYVRAAVNDWQPMLKEVHMAIDHIATASGKDSSEWKTETKNFLEWLVNDNFLFVGCGTYTVGSSKGKEKLSPVKGTEKGILTEADFVLEDSWLAATIPSKIKHHVIIDVGKVNHLSLIHRPAHMDYIQVVYANKDGSIEKIQYFVGLFTSIVYYQNATLIPIIRKKIDYVIKQSGFSHVSHSGKELVTIMQGFPRDELFQIHEKELFQRCMGILALLVRPRVRVFARRDHSGHFVSVLVFIPRERFSAMLSEKIQAILQNVFHGAITNHYSKVTDALLAQVHVVITVSAATPTDIDVTAIEHQIEQVTSIWDDTLQTHTIKYLGESNGDTLFGIYRGAFAEAYKERFRIEEAYQDMLQIEQAVQAQAARCYFYENLNEPNLFQLKMYSPGVQLPLSHIMPILENMAFHAIDEHTFSIQFNDPARPNVWVHHFRLAVKSGHVPAFETVKGLAEDALMKIWAKELQDDGFNKLIVLAGLTWRKVMILRSLSKYLHQIGFRYSQTYMEEVLSIHPAIASTLVELFYAKFDPLTDKQRAQKIKTLLGKIDTLLAAVTSSTEDKVIRQYTSMIQAIVRTNYFQVDAQQQFKSYLSFKCDSSKVPGLPLPKPYAEIFVCSPRVEGIHLRGGEVARGGLRWSDRGEDFRTEVLGLMKAQMAKNSVIVPVGSKGGFVVKQPPKEGGREAYLQEGIECYKTFLRGLLDLTDNLIEGEIVPPANVVRHDNDDPYLVVAADKGTATFSDIANSISKEYNFWLGDAFASGGSAGYDHKKMGITARGGWISVERHFREMGRDTRTADFTVVGIGDMSGDVFGNGMLLSEHICLVAAFNHLHIFIDPNPDAHKSFAERKRLFQLPRSTWADYNASLISKGGGIFERTSKTLPISKEMKARFDIQEDSLTPEGLIQALLKAPVDLLWNGGIGTYVKATEEANDTVGDRANDNVRVNGNELRCKVVGEGGNLGLTQRGRIEYGRHNGRINTDAIDNSAGVDCSDHEVNIKICFGSALQSGTLTETKRNQILEKMTDEVAHLVLRDNQLQTQALTIAEQQGSRLVESYARLIRHLEQEGILDRKIEHLPSQEELTRRIISKEGFTRPELAVLLAYSKLSIYTNLLHSNLPDDAYFQQELFLYFPKVMQEHYAENIKTHRLRREIIATVLTNNIVNRLGSTFFHLALEDTGLKGCDIARAYTIARDIFDLRSVWHHIESLDGQLPVPLQVELFLDVDNLLRHTIFWLLRNMPQPLEVGEIVKQFAPAIKELVGKLDKVLAGPAKETYDVRFAFYKEQHMPEALAKKLAGLTALRSACDVVEVARSHKSSTLEVANLYFQLETRFSLAWLRDAAGRLSAENYWQNLAFNTLQDDFYDQQRQLASDVMAYLTKQKGSTDAWFQKNQKQIERFDDFIRDLKSQETIDFAMLVVAAKRLDALRG